jgi:RNA polymerase sigma-70 factor, ECF subfamily
VPFAEVFGVVAGPDWMGRQGNPIPALRRMKGMTPHHPGSPRAGLTAATGRRAAWAGGRQAGGLAGQGAEPAEQDLDRLLCRVARGDQAAFEVVYDRLSGPAYGMITRVVWDPAQSEEVTQEVLLEVWRTASRFDARQGSAATWVLTIAHRRAVDRVRSASAAAAREQRAAPLWEPADDVADTVQASLDRERVRRCLRGLTEHQRESITLAYYEGYSYSQVAGLLGVALGTIKTRIRDGLIRMRDCLGVSS